MIVSPVSWIIEKIGTTLSEVTISASDKISSLITPLMASLFGIYVIFIVLNYWRGAESSPITDFIIQIVKCSVVIGVGLNQSNYANTIIPIVTGIGKDLASIIPGVDSINDMDRLLNFYVSIIEKSLEETMHWESAFNFCLVALKSTLVLIGLIPFLVGATVTLIVAEVGSHLLAMVGPLFFAAALFSATRQYFSAWLNSVISYGLLPLMISAISLLAVGISKEALSDKGTLTDATLGSVIGASFLNWVLVYLIYEARSLASSLSAGGISSTTGSSVGENTADGMRSKGKSAAKLTGKGASKAGKGAYKAGKFLYNKIKSNSIKKAG